MELVESCWRRLAEPWRSEPAEPWRSELAEPCLSELAEPCLSELAEPCRMELAEPCRNELADPCLIEPLGLEPLMARRASSKLGPEAWLAAGKYTYIHAIMEIETDLRGAQEKFIYTHHIYAQHTMQRSQ